PPDVRAQPRARRRGGRLPRARDRRQRHDLRRGGHVAVPAAAARTDPRARRPPLLSQTPSSVWHDDVEHHGLSPVHTDPEVRPGLRRARGVHLLPERELGTRRRRSPHAPGARLGELFPAARRAARAGALLLGGRGPSGRPRGGRAGLPLLARGPEMSQNARVSLWLSAVSVIVLLVA